MSKGGRAKSARDKIREQQAADRVREQRKRVVTYVAAGAVALAAVGAGWWYTASRSQSEEAGDSLAPDHGAGRRDRGDGQRRRERAGARRLRGLPVPRLQGAGAGQRPDLQEPRRRGQGQGGLPPDHDLLQEPHQVQLGRGPRPPRAAWPTASSGWPSTTSSTSNQPSETAEGFTTDQLVAWGKEAGVTDPGFDGLRHRRRSTRRPTSTTASRSWHDQQLQGHADHQAQRQGHRQQCRGRASGASRYGHRGRQVAQRPLPSPDMPLASIPSPSQGVWYLGFVPIRAYALCIVLGVIVAVWLSERRWRARGGQAGTIIDIAVPAVIFGLIGGRLYHVITDWQTYFGARAIKEPYRGPVHLGRRARHLGRGRARRRRRLAGLPQARPVAERGRRHGRARHRLRPGHRPLGQLVQPGAVRRRPPRCRGAWRSTRSTGGEPGVLYHPTFLYESLWNLALGIALIWHRQAVRRCATAGCSPSTSPATPLGRFWIEGLRIDPVGGVDHAVEFLGLRLNQWTSIVLFVGALIYFWATRNKTGEEIVVSRRTPTPPTVEPGRTRSTRSRPRRPPQRTPPRKQGEKPASEPRSPEVRGRRQDPGSRRSPAEPAESDRAGETSGRAGGGREAARVRDEPPSPRSR